MTCHFFVTVLIHFTFSHVIFFILHSLMLYYLLQFHFWGKVREKKKKKDVIQYMIYLFKENFFVLIQAQSYCCLPTPIFWLSWPHLSLKPNFTSHDTTSLTKVWLISAHFWYFCLRGWCICISNKQSWLFQQHSSWLGTMQSTYHGPCLPINNMWTIVLPLLCTSIFSNGTFSSWALFFLIYPTVFPNCLSVPTIDSRKRKPPQHKYNNILLNFCLTALEKLFFLWIV